MATFILYLLFSFIVFALSLAFYERYRSTVLYALAIGGIVNANFFHAGNYPIYCFGLPFGIDSIIYSLFAFCVAIMLIKMNKKEAYILSFSSVIAILFSAVMQLVAELLSKGASAQMWATFATFIISAVASIISVFVMIEFVDKLKKKNVNQYVALILGMLIITLVNSVIYYPLALLINGTPSNILILLLTSVIGKLVSVAFAIISLLLMNKIEKVIEFRRGKKLQEKNIVFDDGRQVTLEEINNITNEQNKDE